MGGLKALAVPRSLGCPVRAAVVGAGFAGLINAVKLLSSGVSVDIYEEHDKVGYPKHCTGLVSLRTARLIGRAAETSIEAVYDYLVLRSGGDELRIRARTVKLDRVRLENALLREAEKLGASVRLGERVASVSPGRGEIELENGERHSGYDIIVLAEGLHGMIRRRLSILWTPRTSMGINLEARCPSRGTLTVLEKEGAWFAWLVPTPRSLVAGALGPRPGGVMRASQSIMKESGCDASREVYGGRVIHGPPMPPDQAVRARFAIVGDAAGLTKPLTGGGLYPNTVLAEIASRELRHGYDLSRAYSLAYETLYKRLRRQFRIARALLEGGILWPAVRALARSYSGALELDYDEHEKALRSIVRTLGFKTVSAAARLVLGAPRALAWLPYVLLP